LRSTIFTDSDIAVRLHPIDVAIIAVYLICITLFGLRFRKSQRSLRNYFLADRNIPWWAIGLSIVAAETASLSHRPADVERATRSLQSIIAETGRQGFLGYQFEARLALARIQLKEARGGGARGTLEKLEKDARAVGFEAIALRAARALKS